MFRLYYLISILFNIYIISSAVSSNDVAPEYQTIFNFTTLNDVDGWLEQSDTVRDVGMSKAVLTLQKTKVFQRAVFFALLNPQKNGAGFAGVRKLGLINLSGFTKLKLKCRGQGQYYGYKIILRHKELNDEPNVSFEQYFQAPMEKFDVVELPFIEFKTYYLGKKLNTTILDVSAISSIGLRMYGGVYNPIKQKGPGTLEIDWMMAPTEEFETITLPFSNFKPYYRGQPVNSTDLDVSQISSIGFQMYGGVYLPIKQHGPGTLEIDWLSAAV